MTNLDSILKSRDITLLTKVHIVKAMAFPVSHAWMWELDYKESWVPKKWCFWTVVLEKTLGLLESLGDSWRVPWTARRLNQSILKEINPKYSLEGLMLKLKLQYFGHLMQRIDSLEKTLLLGKTESRRRRRQVGWHQVGTWWTWIWASSRCWWWIGNLGVLQSIGWQKAEHNWVTELIYRHFSFLSHSSSDNWKELLDSWKEMLDI